MNQAKLLYHGYRFPPEIISRAVWLYHRFCISFRDVEDLLAERGIVVSYETIRQWCNTFGPVYARTIKRRRGRLGDTWYLDKVYIVPKSRMNTREHRSDRCDDLNHQDRHSDFWLFTVRFITSLVWVDI